MAPIPMTLSDLEGDFCWSETFLTMYLAKYSTHFNYYVFIYT